MSVACTTRDDLNDPTGADIDLFSFGLKASESSFLGAAGRSSMDSVGRFGIQVHGLRESSGSMTLLFLMDIESVHLRKFLLVGWLLEVRA